MKVITTSILISCLLGKSFLFFGWELWYQLNQQQIAKAYCENNARPAMHCNGKCYLAKQLKKIAKADNDLSHKKNNPYASQAEIQFLSATSITAIYNDFSLPLLSKPCFPKQLGKVTSFSLSLFHPPCC
jgi:hypothetical protein